MSSGHPCANPGHTTRTARGECVACLRLAKKRLYYKDSEKTRAYHREWCRQKAGLPAPARPDPGVCELCGGKNKTGRKLALDHDHVSGAFRGWLCHRCNVGVGMLGDNIAGLEKALAYLNK